MSKNVKINGASYEGVPKISVPLATGEGNADFYELSTANASPADILSGKTAFIPGGQTTGTMTNNGAVEGTISTKDGIYTIPKGYHNGSGTAHISAAEQEKIISENIKSGVTLLGVTGSVSVVETKDATANAASIVSGKTAYINGQKVNGTLTLVKVSQDSTTKVLTIS